MKDKIKKFKEKVLAGCEKEIYKSSIPATVVYKVGDGGEYTREEAEIMAHYYNHGSVDIGWLISNVKRTYGLNSLKEKGVICNYSIKGGYCHFDVDKEAIKNTVQRIER